MFKRYSLGIHDAVRVIAGRPRCSRMLSLELGRLVHEEREQEIEKTRRVRALVALLRADRPVPDDAHRGARLVDEAMLVRRGVVGSR
jgi:hypothetical protein